MILLGLDLGSARCGVCILTDGRPSAACTIDVDGDIGTCAAAILHAVVDSGAERVIAEWGAFYVPKYATSAEAAAMARAREIMAVLLDRIEQACIAMGVPIERMPTSTWRARIGVTRRKTAGVEGFRRAAWAWLNPRRDTTDRAVRMCLDRHFGDLARTLANAHERDACGVALAEHMGAPPPKVRIRAPRAPRTDKAHARAEGPSMLDRVCDAIREHAKPNALHTKPGIRLDVLAVRLAMAPVNVGKHLEKGMAVGRIVKIKIGVYGLANVT